MPSYQLIYTIITGKNKQKKLKPKEEKKEEEARKQETRERENERKMYLKLVTRWIVYMYNVALNIKGLFTRKEGYPFARVTLAIGLKLALVYKQISKLGLPYHAGQLYKIADVFPHA